MFPRFGTMLGDAQTKPPEQAHRPGRPFTTAVCYTASLVWVVNGAAGCSTSDGPKTSAAHPVSINHDHDAGDSQTTSAPHDAGSVQTGDSSAGPGHRDAASADVPPALGLDVFGIAELYPSRLDDDGRRQLWTSEHWAAGPYPLRSGEFDENDPLGLSGMRGQGDLDISPVGELILNGEQPRFYVFSLSDGLWRDVEITVYYRRLADDGTPFAGLVIGTRTAPEGHGDTPCEANTYYSRLRHDGTTDFEKELMHPPSTERNGVPAEELWPETAQLAFDEWIGWKFVIYNTDDDRAVKLESYRDTSEGTAGGDWQLVNETVDDGSWYTETDCAEHSPIDGESDQISLQGGAVFIRNTGIVEARYKWLTIREIDPERK